MRLPLGDRGLGLGGHGDGTRGVDTMVESQRDELGERGTLEHQTKLLRPQRSLNEINGGQDFERQR